jgi:SAM-dependent methyltransferase
LFGVTAEYFDGWFSDIARSTQRQEVFTAGLGTPPEIGPSNGLPFSGLQEIAALLAVPADGLLVDLACGRGGPGMWLARELGCRLVGVDFSAEAVRQATDRRSLFGLEDRADFRVGTLDATGLPSDSADALVCIDAFQFSTDHAATAGEIRRLVKPGGQVVLTTWEGLDPDDENLGRLRDVHLEDALWEAGFDEVVLQERRDWHENAHRMWSDVAAGGRGDDPAMQSSYDEALRSLERHDKMRRVMGVATTP